jgi:hypothetical protein
MSDASKKKPLKIVLGTRLEMLLYYPSIKAHNVTSFETTFCEKPWHSTPHELILKNHHATMWSSQTHQYSAKQKITSITRVSFVFLAVLHKNWQWRGSETEESQMLEGYSIWDFFAKLSYLSLKKPTLIFSGLPAASPHPSPRCRLSPTTAGPSPAPPLHHPTGPRPAGARQS